MIDEKLSSEEMLKQKIDEIKKGCNKKRGFKYFCTNCDESTIITFGSFPTCGKCMRADAKIYEDKKGLIKIDILCNKDNLCFKCLGKLEILENDVEKIIEMVREEERRILKEKINEEKLTDRFFLEEIVFALKSFIENSSNDKVSIDHIKTLTSDWLDEMVEEMPLTKKQRELAINEFQGEMNYFTCEEHLRNYLDLKGDLWG